MTENFLTPGATVEGLQLCKPLWRKVQPLPFDVVVVWRPADGRLFSQGAAVRAIYHPLQHAHVLAEARPDKISVLVFAKPIHVKNLRRSIQQTLHQDPVTEIIAHVIATERQHGHWVAPYFADGAEGRRGHFRSHRRP